MSVIVSWGRYGGFYVTRNRVCLGWVALTWFAYEIEDVLRAGLDSLEGGARS